ncbi:MAG: hypothetical protein V7L23_15245 [Nostoc sp.]|uniref:hypothetical protein n=1 Tax=Nostoc sp. TaxID=1180 RepID=UPI002FF2831E
MTKLTGVIQEITEKEGWLRFKPSAPWIGTGTELKTFKILNGILDIEIPPTPKDRVYLVDFSLSEDAPFHTQESWVVPVENSTIEELRHFSTSYIAFLESEGKRLSAEVIRHKDLAISAETRERMAKVSANSVKQETDFLRNVNEKLEEKISELNKIIKQLKKQAGIKESPASTDAKMEEEIPITSTVAMNRVKKAKTPASSSSVQRFL